MYFPKAVRFTKAHNTTTLTIRLLHNFLKNYAQPLLILKKYIIFEALIFFKQNKKPLL